MQNATHARCCFTVQLGRAGRAGKETHAGYLEVLLTAEIEERERNTIDRRIKEAHLPRVKTLEEFDYTQTPLVSRRRCIVAEGGYVERAERVCSSAIVGQARRIF